MLRLLFSFFFFFNDTAPTEIYTLSLHDALPICGGGMVEQVVPKPETEDVVDEAVAPPWMTILHNCECHRSEEHTSELQSLAYLVCRLLLEKKKKRKDSDTNTDTDHVGARNSTRD